MSRTKTSSSSSRKTDSMTFAIGDRVRNDTEHAWGLQKFEGVVVACFLKRDRVSLRYIVESDRGWLQTFRADQLIHVVV